MNHDALERRLKDLESKVNGYHWAGLLFWGLASMFAISCYNGLTFWCLSTFQLRQGRDLQHEIRHSCLLNQPPDEYSRNAANDIKLKDWATP